MADELNEHAEFGRKRKNEEDPILVAQRFLNIYRQMHIFNHARQQQFDNMLLEMPSDIRILLSTLPGGSLLIEHIEELEQKKGLISNISIKKGNTANNLKRVDPKAQKQTGNGGNVVIDASFASELSSSLSLALQQTERRYKEDIKTLTATLTESIMESQSAIGNMIKDILLASRLGGGNLSASNIKFPVINGKTSAPDKEQKSKQVPEPAKPQPETENIPNPTPVTSSAPEPQNETVSPSKEIEKIESAEQNEPMTAEGISKKKKKKKKNKNKNNETFTVLPTADEDLESTETESFVENPTFSEIDLPAKETSDDAFEPAIDETEQNTENNTEDFAIDDLMNDVISGHEDISEPQASDEDSSHFDSISFDTLEAGQPATLTNFDMADISDDSEEPSPYADELSKIRFALENDDDAPQTGEILSNQDDEIFASSSNPLEIESEHPEPKNDFSSEPISEPVSLNDLANEPISLDSIESEPVSLDSIDNTPVSLDDIDFGSNLDSWTQTDSDNINPPDYDPSRIFEDTPQSVQSDSDAWTYRDSTTIEPLPEEQPNEIIENTTIDAQSSPETETTAENDSDWEWEYVEDDGSSGNGDDEWEWEYVEDDGSDEGDWEWEYVEDDGSSDQNNRNK